MFGCTPSQLDDESAVRLDWLIGIDDAFKAAEAQAHEKSNRGK
jgi:hypothetical protein